MITENFVRTNSQPNLQNLHPRTELGRQIKEAFQPIETTIVANYNDLETTIISDLFYEMFVKK